MKKKMKSMFFSILCLSMVTGYCLPTFANEETAPIEKETIIEENQLPQEVENEDAKDETVVSDDATETLPVEEIVLDENNNNGGVDLLKTDVFTISYYLRDYNPTIEGTKIITKTFTSNDFLGFDDSKMSPQYWGSEDLAYFERFNEFAIKNAPDGYVPVGKGATSACIAKESDFSYFLDMVEKTEPENIVTVNFKYFDENGKLLETGTWSYTYKLDEGATKLSAEQINLLPSGYVFNGNEFEIKTVNGETYVHINVKKSNVERMFTMVFLEQVGGEFKRVDSKTIKLTDVAVKDENGSPIVYLDAIKPFIKNGYVLDEKYLHGDDYVYRDYYFEGGFIELNPKAEIVLKKEYKTDEVTGPSVNDDLDIPTVGITLTPEIQSILEESIVDETTKNNIKKALSEGKKVSIKVEYNTQNLDKGDIALVSNYAENNGMKLAYSFDLGINVVTEDGEVLGHITETVKPLSFDFTIPESLKKEGRKFSVLRVHNGVVNALDVTKDTFYTFNTNAFSTYAIAYTDGAYGIGQGTKPEGSLDKEDAKSENEKESVNTAVEVNGIHFIITMMMSISALLLIVGLKKLESNQ